tara:strand:- start:9580 stop:11226 length:1647 start_codon:yes stop_codon:yes gene_type:complete
MQRKKRILFVTESHKLASGFGTYAKEILNRIYKTGKYEIAEFGCYMSPIENESTDWLIYGNAPMPHEEEYRKEHTSNPNVQWGIARFEHAVLDFKPDIVVTYRDPWMDAYIADSVLLPFFHWVWMPTVDSEPQKNEWLYWFNKCDGLMAYSEYGIRTLENQTHGRLKVTDCASPAIDPNTFNIIPNKAKHKQSMGIDPDSFIVGTVMRNQKRKMFPDLIKSFKMFLENAPKEIAEKSFLYLHTSYPEKMGWDITSLVHEYGIGSKILVTYTCKACKKYFCSNYRDAITQCNHCGKTAATMPGVTNGLDHSDLPNIYNLMDLYVQYAICEGFGMPQVEAAACGTPIASIDYSAMEDVVKHCKGYPIKPNLQREMETNAQRSGHNNEELANIMLKCASQNDAQRKKQRLETRKGCISRYTWDKAAKSWEKYFDSVERTKPLEGQWDAPRLMRPVPNEMPKQHINNQQFSEWIYNDVVQDDSEKFSYKMLFMIRNLNFGARIGGDMSPYTKENAFNDSKHLANRRLYFDTIRCEGLQPQDFIIQAHNRIKK